jgi:hypothetical protein
LLKHPKSDGLRFQPATNGNEVGHAPCKPVELCDDENVAFPCIIKRGLELRPLGMGETDGSGRGGSPLGSGACRIIWCDMRLRS